MDINNLQIIPVTLLKSGDWYYPVVQKTGTVAIDDYMRCVVKAPQINRNTGGTYVVTDQGRIDYEIGATVARETVNPDRYAAVSRVGYAPVPPVK